MHYEYYYSGREAPIESFSIVLNFYFWGIDFRSYADWFAA